jgi:hypothetical protein
MDSNPFKENAVRGLIIATEKNSWPESASELYCLSDRCLSAKLVPTFADKGCQRVTDPYGRILNFLTGAATFLSSSSSIVLTRLSGPRSRPTTSHKSGSSGSRTQTSGSLARNSDH